MVAGKAGRSPTHSPVVEAIIEAEHGTTAEIRVHLSKHWFEPNPLKRASRLFDRFGMQSTRDRNGVLLYVNLRRRKIAVVADDGALTAIDKHYWEKLVQQLKAHLRGTHPERAIALAVLEIGDCLRQHFPVEKTQ